MNTPLDSFETALLARLRDHVDQTAPASAPCPHRYRRSQLLIAGVVAVAAAAAMLLVVPGLGTTAAYSVQEGNSGTITVEVHRLEDAKGLAAELADHGVTSDITYVPRSQQCAPGRYTSVSRSLSGLGVAMGSDLLRVTLPPGTVRDGETFVLAVSGRDLSPSELRENEVSGFSGWTKADVTAGAIQPCTPVPGSNN